MAIGARNKERVEGEANTITEEYGVKALGISMDVTIPDQIEAGRQLIEKEFGGIDILINNAGTGTEEKIMEASDEKWYADWWKTATILAEKEGITAKDYLDNVAHAAPIDSFASPEELAETYLFICPQHPIFPSLFLGNLFEEQVEEQPDPGLSAPRDRRRQAKPTK